MWESAGERIKRKQRELALQDTESLQVANVTNVNSRTLAHYQAALSVDLAKVSALKTMEDRVELKRKLLDTYIGFVMDYMNQGHNYPNDVAVQVMVWLFDVAEIEQGLKLAFYLMPHQHMPDRFKRRDIQTFICDAMYEWAKTQLDQCKTASPWLDDVVAKMDTWDLSVPVISKVLVISAKHHFREEHFNTVVELLEKAKRINPEGWGAKTLLAQAKQQL